MAKKSMILKQQAPAKFSTRKYNRCKLCGRPPPISGTTVSAVSASVSWLTRARSPACVRLLSKKIENGAAKRLDELKFVWYAEKWGISEEMHPLRHVQKCFWSLALIFFNKGL